MHPDTQDQSIDETKRLLNMAAKTIFLENFSKMKGGSIASFKNDYHTLYNDVIIPSIEGVLIMKFTTDFENNVLKNENLELKLVIKNIHDSMKIGETKSSIEIMNMVINTIIKHA